MNEIAFADELTELIGSVMNDSPDMLAHVATSFADDTLIEKVEYLASRDVRTQHLKISTRRGDVFVVRVERIKEGGK